MTDDGTVNNENTYPRFFLRVVINIAEKTDKSIMYVDISGSMVLLQKEPLE
jgi:hypothetical protein